MYQQNPVGRHFPSITPIVTPAATDDGDWLSHLADAAKIIEGFNTSSAVQLTDDEVRLILELPANAEM
jgi:hypothetical protein